MCFGVKKAQMLYLSDENITAMAHGSNGLKWISADKILINRKKIIS